MTGPHPGDYGHDPGPSTVAAMRTRLILSLAVLALLVAACGDDDGGLVTTTAGSGDNETTGGPSGGLPECAGLLSLDEVAALFGGTAVFDSENSSGDAARVMCSWVSETREDSLETKLLFVQVYQGAEYYGPEVMYPNAASIEGIGDEAFAEVQAFSMATGAVDGDLSMFVDFSIILGGDEGEVAAKKDQVLDLLRLVHDRAT